MGSVKTKTTDHERSDEYIATRKNYLRELYDRVLNRCGENRKHLLDVATGPGIVVFDLLDEFEELNGVDFSVDRIAEAKRETNRIKDSRVKFDVAGADALPFASEHFDLVTVAQAFQYFPQPNSAQEIYRVLKKCGILAIFWKYPDPLSPVSRLANEALARTNSTLGSKLPLRADMQRRLEGSGFPELLSQQGFRDIEFYKFTGNYNYSVEDWIKSVDWAVGGGNRSIAVDVSERLESELREQLASDHFGAQVPESFHHFLWSARK